MNGFGKLAHWLKPYSWRLFTVVMINIVSIVFSLFSLTFLAPFLMLIFGRSQLVTEMPALGFSVMDVNNVLNYYISQIIIADGKQAALLPLTV